MIIFHLVFDIKERLIYIKSMNSAAQTSGAENMDNSDKTVNTVENYWADTRDEYKAELQQLKEARIAKMDDNELITYHLASARGARLNR